HGTRDADTDDFRVDPGQRHPEGQAGQSPTRSARANDISRAFALLAKLLSELEGTAHVSERAEAIAAAARYDVRIAAAGAQLVRHARHALGSRSIAGEGPRSAKKPVQPHVALDLLDRLPRKHQPALNTGDARRCRGHPAVVRLWRAESHKDVRAEARRIGNEVLELARLVASEREARVVVTLDQESVQAYGRRQARRLLKRRGQGGELESRKSAEAGFHVSQGP